MCLHQDETHLYKEIIQGHRLVLLRLPTLNRPHRLRQSFDPLVEDPPVLYRPSQESDVLRKQFVVVAELFIGGERYGLPV